MVHLKHFGSSLAAQAILKLENTMQRSHQIVSMSLYMKLNSNQQGSLDCQTKQCINHYKGIPQRYNTFVLFDSPQYGQSSGP